MLKDSKREKIKMKHNLGVAVRTTMDAIQTNQYCSVLSRLADQVNIERKSTYKYAKIVQFFQKKARSSVRDLDPTNDVTFLRLRSKKNEILIAPGFQIYYLMDLNFF